MSFPLPNLGVPFTQPDGVLAPQWAGFFQRLHAVTGQTGDAIADPASPDVSAAPGSYDPIWAAEVVALLNEVKAIQIAILDRMREIEEIEK